MHFYFDRDIMQNKTFLPSKKKILTLINNILLKKTLNSFFMLIYLPFTIFDFQYMSS